MKYTSIALILLCSSALAAEYPRPDANGYTSLYDEPVNLTADTCAAGRICHTLPASCTTTFDGTDTTGTIETGLAAASGANRYFCMTSGVDYTGLAGTLDVPSDADCTAANPCWIVNEWNVTTQTLDYPWDTTSGNQAIFDGKFSIDGANWIIAFLKFDGGGTVSGSKMIEITSNVDNTLIHGVEMTDFKSGGANAMIRINTSIDDTIVQNSWLHEWVVEQNKEMFAITIRTGDNNRIVNNTCQNMAKCVAVDTGVDVNGYNAFGFSTNQRIENNDVFMENTYYTDCAGTFTTAGTCMAGRTLFYSVKGTADSGANANLLVNNRIWGGRDTAKDVCCTAQSLGRIFDVGEFLIFAFNIAEDNKGVSDAETTANGNPRRVSFNMNLVYNARDHLGFQASDSFTLKWNQCDNCEAYNNTIVWAGENAVVRMGTSATNTDIKCNVFIDNAAADFTAGTGVEVDYNTFYSTTPFTTGTNDIDKSSMAKWVASTNYSAGDLVTPTTQPADGGFVAVTHGFIYAVDTDSGSAGGTEPTWCTTLGCTVVDSGITWRAIRSPYTYTRNLLVSPETSTIPYAMALNDALLPELGLCAGVGAWSNTSRGADDSVPDWN